MKVFVNFVNKTIFVLMLIVCTGCVDKSGRFPFEPDMAQDFRQQAMQYEKADELQQAIFCWKVVQSFTPDNNTATEQVKRLDQLAREKSRYHFKNAMTLHKKGEVLQAQQELLIALRYQPGNSSALSALRKDNYFYEHLVKEGDTLKSLSLKYYQDKDNEFLIAYFNDIKDVFKPLMAGKVLKFPVLPLVEPQKPAVDLMELLDRAQKSFQAKTYQQTILLAKEVLTYDYTISEAAQLLNRSYLKLAQHQLQKKDYDSAQAALSNVKDNFPGLHPLMEEIIATRQKDAEIHYRKGVKFYVNENLHKAINEWREALRIYPEHDRARLNIKKANSILEKLKTVH